MLKTTYKVKVPEWLEVEHEVDIGSYKLVRNSDGIYLVGFSNVINISLEDIQEVGVTPIDNSYPFELEHRLLREVLYYKVDYADCYFLFDNIEEALDLQSFIIAVKATGLTGAW